MGSRRLYVTQGRGSCLQERPTLTFTSAERHGMATNIYLATKRYGPCSIRSTIPAKALPQTEWPTTDLVAVAADEALCRMRGVLRGAPRNRPASGQFVRTQISLRGPHEIRKRRSFWVHAHSKGRSRCTAAESRHPIGRWQHDDGSFELGRIRRCYKPANEALTLLWRNT